MKKVLIAILFALPLMAGAQIESVPFDIIKNQLNSGMPLPAESPFYVKGLLPQGVRLVQLEIHRGKVRNNPDHSYVWKAPFDYKVEEYELFLSEPLRSNKPYTFIFSFYKNASNAELDHLRNSLHQNLSAYINANYQIDRRGFTSLTPRKTLLNNLSNIVETGAGRYEHFISAEFPGFSDIVEQKIEQLEKSKLKNAKFSVFGGKNDLDSAKVVFAREQIEELVKIVQAEVDQYLAKDMLVLVDTREIADYRTEKLPSYLPINVGYGGAYFSGNFSDFDYGSAPHVGISLPLGNRTFAKYLGNASLSTGVMLLNMENSAGETVSGPLIDRPIYVALGYKFLNVFRFHAGGVVTSRDSNSGTEVISVYPYLGLSFEFDLNIRFNQK